MVPSLSNKSALVFSVGFLFQIFHWGVVLGQFLTWNYPSSSFSLHFNLNKWFSHRSRFFLWFHHLSIVVCCSSSYAALFDFPSSCGIHLIHIKDRLFNQRFERQRCRSGGHEYSSRRFIMYVFSGVEWCNLSIWMNEYHFVFVKKKS